MKQYNPVLRMPGIRVIRGLQASPMPMALLLAAFGCGSSLPPGNEQLTVANEVGTLHGILRVPDGRGPFPVALIIAGSGPTDRDGNSGPDLHTDMYRLLAEGLAARGVASLRYDKRGVGESAGATQPEAQLRLEMFAADAGRFAARLRADSRLGKLVLVGHSEGSLLAMLAAQSTAVGGFVSLAGAGRPIAVVLREQLSRAITDSSLRAQAFAILDQLAAGQTVANVPDSLSPLFRPSVQPYLISWMKYDPAREIGKLSVATLIVQGTTDSQIDVLDAELLAASRPDAVLEIVDGMCHTLKAAAVDSASQRAAYTNPSLPVVAEVVEAIATLALQ